MITLRKLCADLGVPEHLLKKLPRAPKSKDGSVLEGSKEELAMLRLLRQLAIAAAKLVFPAKPEVLLTQAGLKRRQSQSVCWIFVSAQLPPPRTVVVVVVRRVGHLFVGRTPGPVLPATRGAAGVTVGRP